MGTVIIASGSLALLLGGVVAVIPQLVDGILVRCVGHGVIIAYDVMVVP